MKTSNRRLLFLLKAFNGNRRQNRHDVINLIDLEQRKLRQLRSEFTYDQSRVSCIFRNCLKIALRTNWIIYLQDCDRKAKKCSTLLISGVAFLIISTIALGSVIGLLTDPIAIEREQYFGTAVRSTSKCEGNVVSSKFDIKKINCKYSKFSLFA